MKGSYPVYPQDLPTELRQLPRSSRGLQGGDPTRGRASRLRRSDAARFLPSKLVESAEPRVVAVRAGLQVAALFHFQPGATLDAGETARRDDLAGMVGAMVIQVSQDVFSPVLEHGPGLFENDLSSLRP